MKKKSIEKEKKLITHEYVSVKPISKFYFDVFNVVIFPVFVATNWSPFLFQSGHQDSCQITDAVLMADLGLIIFNTFF